MSEPDTARTGGSLFVNVFSGVGLGLLLGVIVGLSLTPVVSVVVGALASMLAVFLGLQGGEGKGSALLGNIRLNGVRIGSFGFATVLGLLLALYVRSSEPFAEPIDQHVQRWMKAGFPAGEARQMVIYERTGIAPKDMTVDMEVAAQQQAQKSHVLFAELDDINLCFELDPQRYGNVPEEVLFSYRSHDNASLERIAGQVEALPPDHQLSVLVMLREFMCDLQRSG